MIALLLILLNCFWMWLAVSIMCLIAMLIIIHHSKTYEPKGGA